MAKAIKQKPAKAVKASKKPLIEGRYSHKFLVRLEPDIGTQLERLMEITGNKTMNGTIVTLIARYTVEHKDLLDTREKLKVADASLSHYQRTIQSFTNAHKAVLELKPLKNVQQKFFDDDDDD